MIVIVVVSCKLFVISAFGGMKCPAAEKDYKDSVKICYKQKYCVTFVLFMCEFLSTNGRLMQGGGVKLSAKRLFC